MEQCRHINPNIKIVLYLINSMDAKSPIMNGVRPQINRFKWDNTYSFDPKDSKRYGYVYMPYVYYSKHEMPKLPSNEEKYDVYFVGGMKGGRATLLEDLYSFLVANGVKCCFDMMRMHEGGDIDNSISGINYYRHWFPYEEVLTKLNSSNCILEVLQEGQKGTSLRYFEAVCYNKKLLTNNDDVVTYPFYNPHYMRIFHTIADVDLDWLKKDMHIEYCYDGEFSPKFLIDKIYGN